MHNQATSASGQRPLRPGRRFIPLPILAALLLAVAALGGCFCVEQRVVDPARGVRPMGLASGLYAHIGPDGEDLGTRIVAWQEDINAVAFLDAKTDALSMDRMAWFLPLRAFGYYIVQTMPENRTGCLFLVSLAQAGYGELTLYSFDPARRDEMEALVVKHNLESERLQNLRGSVEDIKAFFLDFAKSDLLVPNDRYVILKKGAYE